MCSLISLRVYFITTQNFKVILTILKTVQRIIFINEVFVWDNKNIVLPAIFLTSEVVDFRTSLGLSILNMHCPWHVCCDHGARKGDNQSYENESMIFSVSETWRLMAKTWVIAVSCFAGFEALESQPALKMKRQRY